MAFNFRLRLFVADEYKPLKIVHWSLWVFTFGAFLGQIAFHYLVVPPPQIKIAQLQKPPSSLALKMIAFGEEATLSRIMSLQLQAFDNQPGVSIPFREINYEKLGDWLSRIVELDERAEYPHFLMSKVYSSVNDKQRRIQSVQWTREHFLENPNSRWEWMAHATNLAKHIIKDDELALTMARELRVNTTPGKVPNWTRQMEAFFLENHDEFESAATILSNQLADGSITEPQEFAFLTMRLEDILKKMFERGELNEKELFERVDTLENLHQQFLANQ